MADSLDDFFAKKDKKRRDKNKSSAISAVALVKELEEGSKQSEYQVRKEGKPSAALDILGLDANNADWKDFEEIEKRDYTGLKVKEMSIQDQDDESRRQIERAEQAPEPVPWRSKEQTVAAITSSNTDPTLALEQQLLEQLADNEDVVADSTNSNSDTKNEKVSELNKDSDATSETTTATPATDKESDTLQSKSDEKPPATITESTKNDGDTKKQDTTATTTTSAKQKYVPPHERGEAKTLEPMRMKHLVRFGSGANAPAINLQDENEYPSLG